MEDTLEVLIPESGAEGIETFVEKARDATDATYRFLRDAAAGQALAAAIPEAADGLYAAGHGAQACRLADHLAKTLLPAHCRDRDSFVRGVRAGFAAGCLVQWRVLEYLIGDELPLWPVERGTGDREVD